MSVEALKAPITAAAPAIAKGVARSAFSAPISGLGEGSISIGSAFSPMPDLGGSFKPNVTVEGLRGLPEVGLHSPSLDTFFPTYGNISSVDIFTIPKPEEFTSPATTIAEDLTSIVIEAPEPEIYSFLDEPFTIYARRLVGSLAEKPVSVPVVSEALPTVLVGNIFPHEEIADLKLASEVEAYIQTSAGFTPEERTFWETKVYNLVEPKTELETKSAVKTEAMTQTLPLTVNEIKQAPPPPRIPFRTAFSQPQPEPEETEEEPKDPEWKVFTVDPYWSLDKKIYEKRIKRVDEAIDASANRYLPDDYIIGNIATMDIPNTEEWTRIQRRDLVMPKVVSKIDYALSFVDPKDVDEISETAHEVVAENAPTQKNRIVTFIERVRQSELAHPIRALADLGARFIVLNEESRQWEITKKRPRTEPVELEKEKRRSSDLFSLKNKL